MYTAGFGWFFCCQNFSRHYLIAVFITKACNKHCTTISVYEKLIQFHEIMYYEDKSERESVYFPLGFTRMDKNEENALLPWF
ncbi:hypothetical protein SDC9_97309 [bioreactor metagenome]|uniref:Uncharacterized protein n=1 Tax=bioreactor metagenome TaxID=1076179 RepID=A0A645AC09_9ZZZZ